MESFPNSVRESVAAAAANEDGAAAKAPVREPGPPPGMEPDPVPNPDPTPGGPDPEPERQGTREQGSEGKREQEHRDKGTKGQGTREQGNKGAREQGSEGTDAPPLVLTHPNAAEKTAKGGAGKPAAKEKKPEAEEFSPFEVMVRQVYDGPLDLLLDLIRKQDIDIYDIPIAKITGQFLTYVNQLKASDVDVAGEFIYTASLLIHIKSKMLLPREKLGPEDAGEDPRRELVERLLEHERFKNAAQMLKQKQMLEAATWTNPGVREFREDVNAEPEVAADTTDLVRIFRDIMERARKRPTFNVQDDAVTVGQMIQFLSRRLMMEDRPVGLRKLLAHTKSERALVALFLALLELVRLQAILLRQDRAFSEIFIKKSSGFDSVVAEGLAARDDWK
jgi:segregation and condensation protein A